MGFEWTHPTTSTVLVAGGALQKLLLCRPNAGEGVRLSATPGPLPVHERHPHNTAVRHVRAGVCKACCACAVQGGFSTVRQRELLPHLYDEQTPVFSHFVHRPRRRVAAEEGAKAVHIGHATLANVTHRCGCRWLRNTAPLAPAATRVWRHLKSDVAPARLQVVVMASTRHKATGLWGATTEGATTPVTPQPRRSRWDSSGSRSYRQKDREDG